MEAERPLMRLVEADDPELESAIGEGLRSYNVGEFGRVDAKPLGVALTHPRSGKVLGGLIGRTSLGVLFIDLVYLPEMARGQGLGRSVVRLAEDAARRRGCSAAVVYTASFQAPGFYQRLGYREFGRVEPEPPGAARIYLKKRLGSD